MKETDKLGDTKDKFPYEDILYFEHPTSKHHTRQSMESRAGQFSPFAALTGYGDTVKETERTTETEVFLEEDRKERLDEIIQILNITHDQQEIEVTFFQKDKTKEGGSYSVKRGIYKRVDVYKDYFEFEDKTKIPLKDIVKIEIINKQDN